MSALTTVRLFISVILLLLISVTSGLTAGLSEKTRDVSPDGKFAMRIAFDSELNAQIQAHPDERRPQIDKNGDKIADPDHIASEAIKTIELVSLPKKEVAANLLPEDERGGYDLYSDIRLLWSADSKWCAFSFNFPRVGYTTIYQQIADKFRELNKPEELKADVKGDVRYEYIRPVRWEKPGVLVLDQLSIFRETTGLPPTTLELTAGLDRKSGRFKILSKRNSVQRANNN
jgi:hypothetical protein